ncbi:hypothetical protein C7974DRAFT_331457 [Boeremia exigua]|uniref:uncharacterized protein n=1 Tax=Boeremia exigua TaxID=749465 RepID=UPI001E8CEFBB|nr:uncharacterized protein C7974DRAFT_331457 [Boeremia exigua]KAH6639844.1 hypothetical protein C7974DRAFT_331457 [Boeremia exigua]
MHISTLLSLPSSVLLLLCATPVASAQQQQWPHNLPRHVKYFPEEEQNVKRGLEIRERLRHEKPVGMKKMSTDEGEMFMLDNWVFASSERKRAEYGDLGNGTYLAQPAIRPNAADEWFERQRIRDVLLKRQFRCPEGTLSCSSIGAPDVCCGGSSTCVRVQDSDIGDVGCCPNGQICSGSISCNEAAGYTACPNSSNGGCCLPGFQCSGIGCVAAGTSITYVQPSTSARPSSSLGATSTPASSSATPTTSSTPSSTPAPSSSSNPSSAYTCSTGWFSCPVSLGGGCCQNGRECATGASCIGDEPSSQAPSAPVRPTSEAATTTTEGDVCPTGFYVCSAYYPSGCCRVGRDCQTTGSCVLPSSTTVIETNGVTVVAPSGASVAINGAAEGSSCPSAWYSCPAIDGGNCCPNGYACGEQCTATASGVSSVEAKVAPSTASFVPQWSIWGMVIAACAIGAAMVAL